MTCIFGLICILLVLTNGCSNQEMDIVTIDKDGSFDPLDCKNRGLNDKVIMLESKYCGHCKATLPFFLQACAEKGVEPSVLDLSVDEQREQMESFGISIQYTPTFIFGCDYYVGVHSKEDYLTFLDKYLSS